MKKTYEKPTLQKRGRLSAATSAAPASGFSF
ncbi:putative RiPP precursor [Mesorhizobium sp. ORS 3428]|nr:putative RiPP precursor [Mesorhizobium sp. ORS 3428]